MASAVIASFRALGAPASADGTLAITNRTMDAPTMVDVKLGSGLDDAVEVTMKTLAKGETLNLDATNLQYYWRHEVNPGSGDGKYTDWQRVDTSSVDQHVYF